GRDGASKHLRTSILVGMELLNTFEHPSGLGWNFQTPSNIHPVWDGTSKHHRSTHPGRDGTSKHLRTSIRFGMKRHENH
ncbi:MAG: hypothetical protein MI866_14045, partial [Bacteroidales bacterium]|nr:hypothetical protein [Bacteroidales bacterium]